MVINDANFQTSSICSLVFKRNSGFFVSYPIPVPSPSLQLSYYFSFLKEALRWKEGPWTLRCLVLWDLWWWFLPTPYLWLWDPVCREYKIILVDRTFLNEGC